MKTLAVSALILVALTGVGFSQSPQPRGSGENINTEAAKEDAAARRAKVEQEKQKELDAAYRAALRRQSAPAAAADPWATVRPTTAPSSNRQ